MLTILLPALIRLRGGLAAAPQLARWLGCADALAPGKPGRDEQLLRHFDVRPRTLPDAPISRELDVGDGGYGAWLRCDPTYVRADLTTVRMLAYGDGLELTPDEAQALIAPLKPLFGDAGMPISAPLAQRWYLMLPADARLPVFSRPDEVLGDDLGAHLPEGPEGRRWRHLLNEAQVLLHQHPHNAERVAAGKAAVNSLWFFGGGRLPTQVKTGAARVASGDLLIQGLCRLAGVECIAPAGLQQALADCELIDLRRARDIAELEGELLPALLQCLARRERTAVRLDFADGHGFELRREQRWRWLRRPLRDWSAA